MVMLANALTGLKTLILITITVLSVTPLPLTFCTKIYPMKIIHKSSKVINVLILFLTIWRQWHFLWCFAFGVCFSNYCLLTQISEKGINISKKVLRKQIIQKIILIDQILRHWCWHLKKFYQMISMPRVSLSWVTSATLADANSKNSWTHPKFEMWN